MIDTTSNPARTLMIGGAWTAPENERPPNWRDISEKENIIPSAGPDQPDIQNEPDDRFPVPPAQYGPVFLPIIEGILAGVKARKELMELTHYCMLLEIAMQESELRRAAKIRPDWIENAK
jgi:hypothetical protein